MGSQDRLLVGLPSTLEQMKCPETPTGNHRWIHDGLLFAFFGEEEPECPWLWKCLYCELRIRTPFKLEKVEYEGNVIDKVDRRKEA